MLMNPRCFEEAVDVSQTEDGSLTSSFTAVGGCGLVGGIKQRDSVLIPGWIKSCSLRSLTRPRPVD